jgi:serine/threonine protein kinase
MHLPPGTQLGPYEILAQLGAAGMGEVYSARDIRLGRNIAVKILPESFARDHERVQRLEQESHALAALNHRNVLDVYDVGSQDGVYYLVAELLDGDERAV